MRTRDIFRRTVAGALLTFATFAHDASAQATAAAPATTLTIAGDVTKAMSFTAADLKRLPRQRSEVKAEDGTSDIMVADTIDGKPLAENQGPFRIVAPKDSRASRSVRMLQRLEVARLRK